MRALAVSLEIVDGNAVCRGDAQRLARRLLALDPIAEPAHCLVMRYCALSGDRAGVARAFRECERALREALGIPPSAATASARPPSTKPSPPPSTTSPSRAAFHPLRTESALQGRVLSYFGAAYRAARTP